MPDTSSTVHVTGLAQPFTVNEAPDEIGRLIVEAETNGAGDGWLRLTRYSTSREVIIRATAIAALEA